MMLNVRIAGNRGEIEHDDNTVVNSDEAEREDTGNRGETEHEDSR